MPDAHERWGTDPDGTLGDQPSPTAMDAALAKALAYAYLLTDGTPEGAEELVRHRIVALNTAATDDETLDLIDGALAAGRAGWLDRLGRALKREAPADLPPVITYEVVAAHVHPRREGAVDQVETYEPEHQEARGLAQFAAPPGTWRRGQRFEVTVEAIAPRHEEIPADRMRQHLDRWEADSGGLTVHLLEQHGIESPYDRPPLDAGGWSHLDQLHRHEHAEAAS